MDQLKINLETSEKNIPCPHCREMIRSDASVCNQCNRYKSKMRNFLNAPNVLSFMLLIISGFQALEAYQENNQATIYSSQARAAAIKAEKALHEVEAIRKEIIKRDSIIRLGLKAQFERNAYKDSYIITAETTPEMQELMNKQLPIFTQMIEPDYQKRKEWLKSVEDNVKRTWKKRGVTWDESTSFY